MKGKKWIVIVASIVIILIGARFTAGYIATRTPEEKKTEFGAAAKLFICGDDIVFDENVSYEKVDTMEEDKLVGEDSYVYLVINDLKGNVSFNETDVKRLKTLADQNEFFQFLYLGTEKLKLFTESGLFQYYAMQEGEMSFGYIRTDEKRMTYSGAWTENDQQHYKKNKALLGETLVDIILQTL